MSFCGALLQSASPPSSSPGCNLSSSYSHLSNTSNIDVDDYLLGYQRSDPDSRIRQRLEASRQGMLQLETLRNKHQKLMKEMRLRLSRFTELSKKQNSTVNKRVDSITAASNSEETRSESPISCCFSHRSSVSVDSGCASIASDPSVSSNGSTIAYNNYSTKSNDGQTENSENITSMKNNQEIVATAIESATALRCHGTKRYIRHWQRPKSLCAFLENNLLVDSYSFSQITPPPMHRKITTPVARSESVQTRRPPIAESCCDVRLDTAKQYLLTPMPFLNRQPQPVFHASRVFVERSSPRNRRPQSMLVTSRTMADDDDKSECFANLTKEQSFASTSDVSPAFDLSRFQMLRSSNPELKKTAEYTSRETCLNRQNNCQNEALLFEQSRRRLVPEKKWKESEDL
uniref:Uncharacterized protein n=1 Tax=Syphacia muris TaxID=451379 RepID=A0A0N5AZ74_9BILA